MTCSSNQLYEFIMSSSGYGYGGQSFNNGYQYVNDSQQGKNWSGGDAAANTHVPPPVVRASTDAQPQHESRYIPPHLRHATAPDSIPEGGPAPDTWSRGQQQYQRGGGGQGGAPRGGYVGGGGGSMRKSQSFTGMQQPGGAPRGGYVGGGGSMRKSQSFTGMQQPHNEIGGQNWNSGQGGGFEYQPTLGGQPGRGRAGFGPPTGGFRSGTGGHSRGRGASNRGDGGDFGGGRGMGPRPNYSGRYSYDRRWPNGAGAYTSYGQSPTRLLRTADRSKPDVFIRGGLGGGGVGRCARTMHDEQQWGSQHQGGGGGFRRQENDVPENPRWAALRDPIPERVPKWTEQLPRDERLESELFAGMNSGINFDKYEEIPVEATGQDCPPPISLFGDLKLHPWIEENIKMSGYGRPTPVQKYSIPTLMNNRDLMSCAQTGSGKTAAFLVPLINNVLQDGPEALYRSQTQQNGRRKQYPAALILSPTRELSLQIYNESRKFAYRTPITSALLYGGRENYREQINKLRLGVHILIATPGRLIDVMEQGYIGLDGCRFLVLDEADRMLDMGFEPQIRQVGTLMIVEFDLDSVSFRFRLASVDVYLVAQISFGEQPTALTLVFVETKRGASDLAYYLQRDGYNVVAIHGDLKQFDREKHLETFRSGVAPILVATAVAARGLDIPNVKHVINYDLPSDIDEYVHRIGRTGRVGNVGLATSFFNDKNRNISRDLAELIVEANQELPEWLEKLSADAQRYGSRGGRVKGGGRFGARDHRVQYTGSNPNPNSQHRSNGSSYGPSAMSNQWNQPQRAAAQRIPPQQVHTHLLLNY
ncbi:unnamed protein product [Anisakis simplex]|uniref:RNA helicase n=1 Tax=Anisakis simplex TaxID=6269 RepID=A0A158PPS2_ANISI|nr:unnamed protein product [Anisakis simplex]